LPLLTPPALVHTPLVSRFVLFQRPQLLEADVSRKGWSQGKWFHQSSVPVKTESPHLQGTDSHHNLKLNKSRISPSTVTTVKDVVGFSTGGILQFCATVLIAGLFWDSSLRNSPVRLGAVVLIGD
jgi:hypothetical protein